MVGWGRSLYARRCQPQRSGHDDSAIGSALSMSAACPLFTDVSYFAPAANTILQPAGIFKGLQCCIFARAKRFLATCSAHFSVLHWFRFLFLISIHSL